MFLNVNPFYTFSSIFSLSSFNVLATSFLFLCLALLMYLNWSVKQVENCVKYFHCSREKLQTFNLLFAWMSAFECTFVFYFFLPKIYSLKKCICKLLMRCLVLNEKPFCVVQNVELFYLKFSNYRPPVLPQMGSFDWSRWHYWRTKRLFEMRHQCDN